MESIFFRLLKVDIDNKGEELLKSIRDFNNGVQNNNVYTVNQDSFKIVPNTPFSYWVSDRIRNKFREFPLFEGNGGTVRQGLATADDFRFLRTNWEVRPNDINAVKWSVWCSVKHAKSAEHRNLFVHKTATKRWVNLAKGGEYSPYYSDLHLVVNWKNEGSEIWNNLNEKGHIRSNIWMLRDTIKDYFFRAGLTWIYRSNKGFSVRVKSPGTIHSHAGHSAFPDDGMELAELAWLNSEPTKFLLRMMTTNKWEIGYVQRLPIPIKNPNNIECHLVEKIFDLYRSFFMSDETTHIFTLPSLLSIDSVNFSDINIYLDRESIEKNNQIEILQKKLDNTIYGLYNIHLSDRQTIEDSLKQGTNLSDEAKEDSDEETEEEIEVSESISHRTEDLLMWCIGVVFGRWDIRMALDKSLIPKLADPFDPLPVCSPGMLLSPDGYPATSGHIVSEEWLRKRVNVLDVPENVPNPTISDDKYPIAIDWDGILVDDEGHSDDIIKKVREVLSVIYGDKADEREKEILEILELKSLRDYFRQPKRFFDFHIKRYSKSRRKAPIYWLLQTKRKNYGIWLYYHRLDGDTIFKVLRNYVEPKLNLISSQLTEISQKAKSAEGKEKRTYEKEQEKLEELTLEITEFKEELERVAKMGYNPDFDDGVILNMAPLHTVIPWTEPAKYWKELESGKYDWAHIAMKYWSERVKEKCKIDKSLAIAHNIE